MIIVIVLVFAVICLPLLLLPAKDATVRVVYTPDTEEDVETESDDDSFPTIY